LPPGTALVPGLGAERVQRRDAARTGTDGQGPWVGALPGREGHAQGKLSPYRGIDGIGLGARLHRLGEALSGLGVDYHDSQPGVIQGQIKMIEAGGLQAEAAHLSLTQTEHRTMNTDLTNELQTRVLAAIESDTPLEIRGGGSKRFLGRTPTGEPLEVADHAGIVNYQPKELVVTARCGTTLETLEATLTEQGQMLPFEPPHLGPHATLGGTIACGLSGPARPYAGSARDLVLGARVLTGRGQVLRFGGEVMKNVAGYDLSRLMTGAYGTLGLLLDVSLKVMPIPAAQRTLVQEQPPSEAIRLMNAWAATPLPIKATCWDGERLYVRLAGAEAALARAAETIGGETVADQDELWHTRIREQGHDFFTFLTGEAELWRLSLPSATPHLDLPGRQLIEWGGAQRWYRGEPATQAVREAAITAGGHATLFRGGDRDGEVFQPLPPPLMTIHLNLRQAFDPKGLLNPGRLYAGL